ncbi:MAG: acyl-CoA reductase, partial [Promethearchaeota archaeon]
MYSAINTLDSPLITEKQDDNVITLPWLIRGKELTEDYVEYPVRYGKRSILTPDAKQLWTELICSANDLKDIHEIPLSEIISFLVRVGYALDNESNPYVKRAIELTNDASNLTEPIIRSSYYLMQEMFSIPSLSGMNRPIGYEYLDSWVKRQTVFGEAAIKAVGCRTLHIPAGNVPAISALSIINGALTKGDTLIKLPSNDPVTAWAIIKTMMDLDP